jgi:hypothetical protein
LQLEFLAKLKITEIPSMIQLQLTPERIQAFITEQDPTPLLQIHRNLDTFCERALGGDMLQLVRRTEKQGDWVSSYFLAHLFSISRIHQFFCLKNGIPDGYTIFREFPFLSWMLLLQNPEIADHCMTQFKKSMDHFHLTSEGKALCAEHIFQVYRDAMDRSLDFTDAKRHCLAILATLVKDPEGSKAMTAAGGLKFLITSLKELTKTEDYLTNPICLQHAAHLIHIIIPLTTVPISHNGAMVTTVLHTLSQSWKLLEGKDPIDLPLQELQRLTIETLQILDTLAISSYTPSFEDVFHPPSKEEQKNNGVVTKRQLSRSFCNLL